MAPSPREVQIEMDKMRELLRRVLGVSAIPADLSDIVSLLLKGLRELELKCPKLMCHLHVSGVSEASGQSFFVVLHDSALDNNCAARRVVKSVYTHLHSKASMAMTSALWLASRSGKPSTTPAAGVVSRRRGDPAPASNAAAGAPPDAGIDQGGNSGDGKNEDAPGRANHPPSTASLSADPPPTERGDQGQPGCVKQSPAHPPLIPLAPLDPLIDLAAGFRAPEVFVPSFSARNQMEALFTARKSGWSALLRETLIEMRAVLRGHHGVTHLPRLMGMLKWWPVNLEGTPEVTPDDAPTNVRKGNVPQCSHFAFPVLVQRRHVPIRKRVRDRHDFEEEVVEVSNIVPPRSKSLYGVVASILLLMDKEPCVLPVVAKKLATCGIVLSEDGDDDADDVTPPVVDDLDDFVDPPDSPLLSPPPLDDEERDSDPEPLDKNAPEAGDKAAVAARLASRQNAAASSAKAQEAIDAKKAAASAGKPPKKRKSSSGTPATSKRARLAARLDEELASELFLPPLIVNDDVESCTVLVEAGMVVNMTYLTLATNWCMPAVGAHKASATAEVAEADGWARIVEQQAAIDFLLSEDDVRQALRTTTGKADQVRADGTADADQRAPVFFLATSIDGLPARTLTLPTLEAMGTIHRAGLRLQELRVAVAWLQQSCTKSSPCVPSFLGGSAASIGAAGTAVMETLLSQSPNASEWRVGTRGCGGLDEDVVVSAHQIVNNMADVDMVDDIITVNSIILQRLCTQNGIKAHNLQCSLFNRLLQASNDVAVSTVAEEVHQQANGASTFAGVCNSRNSHWIAFSVDVKTKTITRYDSGPHFTSLATAVSAALERVREFSKSLAELYEETVDDVVNGGDTNDVHEAVVVAPKKTKVWSVRQISVPTQTDTCSCGPFAFGFVWHAAQGKKSKLKTVDAAAVRMEMLATIVTDGTSPPDEEEMGG